LVLSGHYSIRHSDNGFWTIGIAMSLEFGTEEEKPTYVGLSNTLIAPSTILSPLIGGWLADISSFSVTFLTAAVFSIICVIIMQIFVKDRGKRHMTI
jgi:MFS family permease